MSVQAFMQLSVQTGRPVVSAVYMGEANGAKVKAQAGWGANVATQTLELLALGA